ncbi:hypothetical protein J2W32_003514 [Variovorax boronicumulans]|uniref:DUF1911 domain-containing protein n=1 Tax=Variovorax boronicumulans TaxID=436515 RepID=A0AAW8D1P7_9BURK|nr:PoNe immunity protein domain-containing protein [Variovorax boronicumulans]MDP9894638.1 hypothetical protein [Variovorax boronicumulans]MDQ0054457.1 hypothetical protein [Variovorax boronicumulans]
MTADEFRAKRRQKFLPEIYFSLNINFLAMLTNASLAGIKETGVISAGGPNGQRSIFQDKLNLLKLHYTAGWPIDQLTPLYADAIKALGEWHAAYQIYIKVLAEESGDDLRDDGTPLDFENLLDYQLTLDVVSLGVLLGDGDALRQCALWLRQERGTDLLFESLLAPTVPDPRDNTDFYHLVPYDPLIDAFYTVETPKEASAKVKEYLESWYKSFEGAPWHNGHLHAVEGEYMPYYGYWSFEAAAVCVINGIDDSTFRDHLLYPKDLADWARANHSLANLKPGASKAKGVVSHSARVPGGESCPRTGWWLTPAKVGSRRYFKVGEIMPVIDGSSYGSTFWQWDVDQSSPKL